MSQNELTAKIKELKSLEQLIEEAQQEAEAIKDELKEQMKASGTDEIIVDIFKVRWKAVKSNKFDTTAFKLTHKELYEQYTKSTESRRFTVTV